MEYTELEQEWEDILTISYHIWVIGHWGSTQCRQNNNRNETGGEACKQTAAIHKTELP